MSFAVLSSGSASRPAVRQQAPLPPFDPNDAGGQVHTTPPPELVIPKGPDPLFMRADFNGVTLNADRWGGMQRFIDTFAKGANTTPYNMLMTPMAPLYPRDIQDAMLTEHAERGDTHFVVASGGWNFEANGFYWSPAQFAAWCDYVASWGFLVTYWGPVLRATSNAYLKAALNVIAFHIVGEEVDGKVTAEEYELILDDCLSVTGSLPTAAHFTANYPSGAPRDTFLTNWDKYNGKVHLCWQANVNDSAGTQAARLYYARQRVNLGLVGGNGRPAPDSRVYAYETMAFAQLEGRCDEAYGNLRSLELLYATRLDPGIRPMAGVGNGCRYPDGTPI